MAHYVEVRCMLINVYCTVIFAHTFSFKKMLNEVHYRYFVYVFSLISIYVIMNDEFRNT